MWKRVRLYIRNLRDVEFPSRDEHYWVKDPEGDWRFETDPYPLRFSYQDGKFRKV